MEGVSRVRCETSGRASATRRCELPGPDPAAPARRGRRRGEQQAARSRTSTSLPGVAGEAGCTVSAQAISSSAIAAVSLSATTIARTRPGTGVRSLPNATECDDPPASIPHEHASLTESAARAHPDEQQRRQRRRPSSWPRQSWRRSRSDSRSLRSGISSRAASRRRDGARAGRPSQDSRSAVASRAGARRCAPPSGARRANGR